VGYFLYRSGIKIKIHSQKKVTKMKKLFAILAIASVMTACGGAKTETPAADTTKAVVDTTKKDTAKVAVDTTKKDTTKK